MEAALRGCSRTPAKGFDTGFQQRIALDESGRIVYLAKLIAGLFVQRAVKAFAPWRRFECHLMRVVRCWNGKRWQTSSQKERVSQCGARVLGRRSNNFAPSA